MPRPLSARPLVARISAETRLVSGERNFIIVTRQGRNSAGNLEGNTWAWPRGITGVRNFCLLPGVSPIPVRTE